MYTIIKPNAKNTENVSSYSLINKVLSVSGLSSEQIKELFSNDTELHTSGAECVLNCAERIRKAAENNERVFIGGDYDTDGICATAIMKATLDRMNIQNGYYIPDRVKEGYGLHAHTVEAVAQKGYSLIITVDNGVKAHEAIAKAHELGVDIVITDHHEISEPVDTDIVVHPDYMEPEYQYLCGAGVALEISRNLIGNQEDLNAIAAVAHIGDVMPFWKETRRIIKHGIEQIKKNEVLVFSNMLRNTSVITDTDISFQIVPKLNSVGRLKDMGNVNQVVKALLEKDPDSAKHVTKQLEDLNDVRKQLSEKMAGLAEGFVKEDDNVIVLYDDSFSEGMNGLVAGKLTNKYNKPSVVFSANGSTLKGSARSVPGINIFEILNGYSRKLAFGGHEMAAGISINAADLDDFRQYVNKACEQITAPETGTLAVLISPEDITVDAVSCIESLSPVPKEICCTFAVPYNGQDPIYRAAKVLKYRFINSSGSYDAILFTGKGIDMKTGYIIGKLNNNVFRDTVTPQLIVDSCEPLDAA